MHRRGLIARCEIRESTEGCLPYRSRPLSITPSELGREPRMESFWTQASIPRLLVVCSCLTRAWHTVSKQEATSVLGRTEGAGPPSWPTNNEDVTSLCPVEIARKPIIGGRFGPGIPIPSLPNMSSSCGWNHPSRHWQCNKDRSPIVRGGKLDEQSIQQEYSTGKERGLRLLATTSLRSSLPSPLYRSGAGNCPRRVLLPGPVEDGQDSPRKKRC